MSEKDTSILFVCMGNICRSPTAECFFRNAIESRGIASRFTLDSAGTGGWHAGASPDRRMRAAAKRQGKVIQGSARQVTVDDFETFDYIFCMDRENYTDLMAMGASGTNTHIVLEYINHATQMDVPDPYYGGEDGFDNVVLLIDDAMQRLADMFT